MNFTLWKYLCYYAPWAKALTHFVMLNLFNIYLYIRDFINELLFQIKAVEKGGKPALNGNTKQTHIDANT